MIPNGLRRLWFTDVGLPYDDPSGTVVLDTVIARYAETHRRYHGVRHVVSVVELVHGRALRLAAWYHDAIYDPRSSTNEDDSAELAADQLSMLELPTDTIDAVRRLIMVTKTHTPQLPDEEVLIDADLAILAAPPDVYETYVAGVRAEYGFVDDNGWCAGRAAVLRSFLEREHIFHMPSARAAGEKQARENLRRELAGLSG